MAEEINCIYGLADNLYNDGGSMTEDEVSEFLDVMNKPQKYKNVNGVMYDKLFVCKDNGFGVTSIKFTDEPDCICLSFSDGTMQQNIKFGKSKFIENNIMIKTLKPTLESIAGREGKEMTHFAAWCTGENDRLHLHLNYLDNPHIKLF